MIPSFFKNYFNNAKHYSSVRFILEMTALVFLSKIVFSIIIFAIFNINSDLEGVRLTEEDIKTYGYFSTLILASIIAPLVETPLGQMLPIWITSKFTNKDSLKIITSAIFFSALHWPIQDIIVAFPATIIFAWVYVTKRKISLKAAFINTALIHSLHNFIASLLYLI